MLPNVKIIIQYIEIIKAVAVDSFNINATQQILKSEI